MRLDDMSDFVSYYEEVAREALASAVLPQKSLLETLNAQLHDTGILSDIDFVTTYVHPFLDDGIDTLQSLTQYYRESIQLHLSESFAVVNTTLTALQSLPYDYTAHLGSLINDVLESAEHSLIDAIRQTIDPPLDLLHEQLAAGQDALDQMHGRFIQELQSLVGPALSITDLSKVIQRSELAAFAAVAELPALSTVSQHILDALQESYVSNGEDNLLTDLSELFTSVMQSDTVASHDSLIAEIETRFAQHVSTIKPNRTTFEGLTNTMWQIIFLVMALLAWHSDMVTGQTLEEHTDVSKVQLEALDDRFESLDQRVATLVNLTERLLYVVEQVDSAPDKTITLVTKQSTVIRVEPSKTGARISRIYPNQRVQQIKREQDWVYVEYFDYVESIPRTGWSYRRNFVVLKEER